MVVGNRVIPGGPTVDNAPSHEQQLRSCPGCRRSNRCC